MNSISFISLSFYAVISGCTNARQLNFSGRGYVYISKPDRGETHQHIKVAGAKASVTVLCAGLGVYFELDLVWFPDSNVLTTHAI